MRSEGPPLVLSLTPPFCPELRQALRKVWNCAGVTGVTQCWGYTTDGSLSGPHPPSCGRSSLATRFPRPASERHSTVCDILTLLLLLLMLFPKGLASGAWWVRRCSSAALGLPLLLPSLPLWPLLLLLQGSGEPTA